MPEDNGEADQAETNHEDDNENGTPGGSAMIGRHVHSLVQEEAPVVKFVPERNGIAVHGASISKGGGG